MNFNLLKKIMLFALAAMLIAVILFAQKNEKSLLALRWKKVEQLAEKQLPESALKEVNEIFAQAKEENNTIQMIIATIYKMRFTLEIDPDKAPDIIHDFEDFASKESAPDKKALLLSMTAELYARYYQSSAWTINRRTQIIGSVPADMKEWTKNIFFDKISTLLTASIQQSDLLQNTDVMKYEALLNKGDDSRLFQPTLFDFLAYRRVNILKEIEQASGQSNPVDDSIYFNAATEFVGLKLDTIYNKSVENQIADTYQQLLRFHLKSNFPQALLYSDLNRLQYLKSKTKNNKLYFKALETLEEKWASNEYVVEVLAEKAKFLLDEQSNGLDISSSKRKAYNICNDGIKRFPKYKRIEFLQNLKKQIMQKNLQVTHNEVVRSKSSLSVAIKVANINLLEFNIYKINASAKEYYAYRQNRNIHKSVFANRTLLESRTLKIKQDVNFDAKDTTINLSTGDFGIYEIEVFQKLNKKSEETSTTTFVVSDLSFIQRVNESDFKSLYALNRLSGLPQSGVQVNVYQSKWSGNGYNIAQKCTSRTDKNGFCKLPFLNNYTDNIIFLERGNDKFLSSQSYSYYNDTKIRDDEKPLLSIFTDRSLYRPGQIVYFKGIAFYSTKNKQEVQKGADYEVVLFDVNNQKVSSKSFKTNEFGSFAGEFVLPQEGLNGAFRITAGNCSKIIYVEEYKRPTFEVEISKPTSEIQFGGKVLMSGNVKAYAGYNIGNANVKYRITRVSHRYCWWWNEPETEIASGNTQSDVNGNFEVSFDAEKPKTVIESWRGNFYTYTVTADVTDRKGETQSGVQNISVGDKSLFIIASVPEKLEKSSLLKLDISTETLNGEKMESIVDYEIFQLEELTEYVENIKELSKVPNASKMLSGKFNTNDKRLMIDVKKWKSGQYRIILTAKDAFGKEVKTENTTVIYDNADKSPAVKTYKWLQVINSKCAVGEHAKIRFGTSAKNTAVLYEIMQGNKVLESKWLKFNNEIKDFELPFKREYGAGVAVFFTFLKDEKFFTEQVQITRKVVEKKLSPTWSVFRNKLQPGEKAEWTAIIPEVGDKKAAELLVGMYDASLDAIRSHSWNFNPEYREPIAYSPAWNAYSYGLSSDYVFFSNNQSEVTEFRLDNLNWFGLSLSNKNYNTIRIRGAARTGAVLAQENSFEVAEDAVLAFGMQKKSAVTGAIASIGVADKQSAPEQQIEEKAVKIRTNFNETAFFYPQLRTDAKGNVKFTFIAPESLTRWNVNMLAHTADLYYGQKQEQIETQKELMVQMNLPRFVRRSDKLMLSANVINLTDNELNANVALELIDPVTETKIILKDTAVKNIKLAANETKAVTFEISEFIPYELVVCKMIATAGNFSDGEQKYLPVLPDKVLVTESLPLTIRNNQKCTFTFENLLKNASKVDTKNLTVEFSSNPAWYAVQALPTLSAPESENALDYFTAFYANTLAGFIANSNPKIAKVFDQWKNAKGSRDALISNLQKNAELKNMLLEETPWVMAAQDETEQKRQIALLFDLNMQKNQSQQYLDKLLKLQTQNGGFAWYAGMPESRYITQEILLNLARLKRMTTDNGQQTTEFGQQTTDDRLQKAIAAALTYLDLEIAKDFAELKKYNKNYLKQNCVGNMQLFYLHLRSEYSEIPVHVSAQEAVKFYTAQSEKYWTSFTLYGKAMMAVVAYRNGKMQTANIILKSLKENALKTDEFGMYWARNTSGYYWNERPIVVQAAIIEAFAEVSKNTTDIDEMKIWLLKQKQTQRWDSPSATVNAIYALLLQGSDWLTSDGKVAIKLGKKTIEPSSTEAGTGYFKETIPVVTIKPEMGKITIDSFTPSETMNKGGIGWGAIYWQYFQDLTKVEAQGSALKISKKLFVKTTTEGFTQSETLNNSSTSMIPIEQTQLKKGDKVVTRLVISTDRNLEFVALKDLRAACFEPVEQRSGYIWREGVGYYQTTKDASTQFFFNYLPKGTYVFEYELWLNNSGTFTSGIASVQCQYAPEFVSHTGGERILIR